jgi:hypothetical protein
LTDSGTIATRFSSLGFSLRIAILMAAGPLKLSATP